MQFEIVVEKCEDEWFVATCHSLPGCISQGRTKKQAIKNMKEAIHLHLESLTKDAILKNSSNSKIKNPS